MTELEKLKKRLEGASNIGITFGDAKDITPEDIAREMNKALDAIARGDCEIIDDWGDQKPLSQR